MLVAIPLERILYGILLTLMAGFSTILGASVVYFLHKPSEQVLNTALGFSAGVMIAVSIFELLPNSINVLGIGEAGALFMIGVLSTASLDFFIAHEYEYESYKRYHFDESTIFDDFESKKRKITPKNTGECLEEDLTASKLKRTGKFVALGIAIHNFPEGLVTMFGSLQSLEMGLLLALAITMHNIPEGLSVAVPIYASGESKRKAFFYALISGLAEPLGAIVGVTFLLPFIDVLLTESLLAFVAGVMVFISIDEILPCAHESCQTEGKDHFITAGIIFGMFIMLGTILVL